MPKPDMHDLYMTIQEINRIMHGFGFDQKIVLANEFIEVHEKGVRLHLPYELTISLDGVKFSEIDKNLLINAAKAKANARAGWIKPTPKNTPQDGETVCVLTNRNQLDICKYNKGVYIADCIGQVRKNFRAYSPDEIKYYIPKPQEKEQ